MTDLLKINTDLLAGQIRDKINQANDAAHRAVKLAVEAGELLIQAKSALAHGAWTPWLASEFGMSERSAQTYMRLAREFPKLPPEKAQRVAVLPLRRAIKELAKPASSECSERCPTPIFEWPPAEIAKLADWYDLVTMASMVLFADGLGVAEIVERTGFDPYEVERILNPEKPLRFVCESERKLLESNKQAQYSALVDWLIANTHVLWFGDKARSFARWHGMDHTIPALTAIERQWQGREAAASSTLGNLGNDLPSFAWYICVVHDARIAIGLDPHYVGKDLPHLLAEVAEIKPPADTPAANRFCPSMEAAHA